MSDDIGETPVADRFLQEVKGGSEQTRDFCYEMIRMAEEARNQAAKNTQAQALKEFTKPEQRFIRPELTKCHCGGTGVLGYNPKTNEVDFCICAKEKAAIGKHEYLIKHSRIPLELRGAKLADLDVSHPAVDRMKTMAIKFISGTLGKELLLLQGPPGSGKTHVALSIANAFLGQGKEVIFVVFEELLGEMKKGFEKKDKEDALDEITATPLLVLDDIGSENQTPWVREVLYHIVNYRYNRMLRTVITINDELSVLPPRIESRITDKVWSALITLKDVPDYRKLRNPQERLM
jgi:DNA replication protein DnaC